MDVLAGAEGGMTKQIWHFCNLGDWQCTIDWLDHWQTMITGLLALLAAGIAAYISAGALKIGRDQVRAAREQLEAQQRDEVGRRKRNLRAARAALPGVLSAVCDHASNVAKLLVTAWPISATLYPHERAPDQPPIMTIDVPTFPSTLVAPLQDILVNLDDPYIHDRIASIFREAQVFDARTRSLHYGDPVSLEWLGNMILQAATLYARAESLVDYARGESDKVEKDLWPRVFFAIDVLGLHVGFVTDVAEERRRIGRAPGEGDRFLSDYQPNSYAAGS